jgi:hypothetical protein
MSIDYVIEHFHDIIDDPLDMVIWMNGPRHVHSDPHALLQKSEVFIEYMFE